jgi:hypothetical protein
MKRPSGCSLAYYSESSGFESETGNRLSWPGNFPGVTKENQKTLSFDSRSLSRDLNLGTPEYEAGE